MYKLKILTTCDTVHIVLHSMQRCAIQLCYTVIFLEVPIWLLFCQPHINSTLVVTSHESNTFSMSASFDCVELIVCRVGVDPSKHLQRKDTRHKHSTNKHCFHMTQLPKSHVSEMKFRNSTAILHSSDQLYMGL